MYIQGDGGRTQVERASHEVIIQRVSGKKENLLWTGEYLENDCV